MKLLIAALFFSIIGCTPSKKSNKQILNVALTSKISTLDPAVSYDGISAEVVYQIYEPLYEYDYLVRPYRLKPLVASEMPIIDKDGTKYTIKIKKNIEYHPSEAFGKVKRTVKAQDFINQIKRLAHPQTRSNGWWLFDGKVKGLNQFRKEVKNDFSNFFSYKVEGLQAPDDHTLIIELKKPFPQLIFALAMTFTAPVPMELIQFYKNDLGNEGIGTGPFKLIRWDKGLGVHMEKFKDYHKSYYPKKGDRYANQNKLLQDSGKSIPFIDGIHFHIMKENQTRWLSFLKKKIDFLVLTKDNFAVVLDENGELQKEFRDQGIILQIAPTLTYWWLSFNLQDPIVGKNLNLRKAIAHAVDIERYIKIFTNNLALKANSIFPPGIPGYDPTAKLPYSYDMDKAKEFLKLAGYPNGKGLPTLNYDVRGSTQVSRQMGEFISSELGKIGIKVQININTFPAFLNKAKTGQLQFWQGGWIMDYPDPENTVQLLIKKNHPPGPNTAYYSNEGVENNYKKLALMKSGKNKEPILREIEEAVHKDLPWVMQFYSRNYILHHGRVKNFRQSDLIYSYKFLRLQD